MPFYQLIVLAVVGSLTGVLPISDSTHLMLLRHLLHWQDPGLAFDLALQLGALLALLIYFAGIWARVLRAGLDLNTLNPSRHHRLFWLLLVAVIPGLLARFVLERGAAIRFRAPLAGIALIVVAVLLWAGERIKEHNENLFQLRFTDSLLVGFAQALAIMPWVSRSGITMSIGLVRTMKRTTAAEFSLLISAPFVAAEALLRIMDLDSLTMEMQFAPFLTGFVVSSVVGYFVIGALLRSLDRRSFKPFAIYCAALGIFVLAAGPKLQG